MKKTVDAAAKYELSKSERMRLMIEKR